MEAERNCIFLATPVSGFTKRDLLDHPEHILKNNSIVVLAFIANKCNHGMARAPAAFVADSTNQRTRSPACLTRCVDAVGLVRVPRASAPVQLGCI